jgi:putative flippase GtrA
VTCLSLSRRRPGTAGVLGGGSREPVGPVRDTGRRLVARLRRDDTFAQFVRFVLVGGTSTALYAVIFLSFQGVGVRYLEAHLVGTVASSVLSNELHRRLTFHAGERVSWLTAQIEAGSISCAGLVATSAALGWLDAAAGDAHPFWQITLVAAVTALIGLMRFVALRWIFRPTVHSPA